MESLSDSVAVNGWSDAAEGDAAHQLFALPRPPRPGPGPADGGAPDGASWAATLTS